MARTEEYRQRLDDAGANWGTWLGEDVVDDFGDRDAEYLAARDALAVADRSARGTAVAIGTEVVPLMQGVVVNNVFELASEGSGQLNSAANAKGRMVCDVRLLHIPELIVMDFEPGTVSDGALSHFRANVMTEDAKFIDRSEKTSRIGVFGPAAAETIESIGAFAKPLADIPEYHGTWGAIGGNDVVVQALDLTGGPAFDLMFDADIAAAIWDAFRAKGAVPVGEQALEVLRLEAGVPRWGAELDEKVIVLEAGLLDTVAFDKGCYVGQEIIARLDTLGVPAKELRTVVLDSNDVPEVGVTIHDGDKKVGTVRTACYSPRLERAIALAYVKRNHNEPGHGVRIEEVAATVQPLGFALADA